MAQIIREAIYEKKIVIETKDPYLLAIKFIEIAAKHGKIIEHQNTYETDGPVKEVKIDFDLIIKLSSYSRVKFTFNVLGKTNEISFISVNIKGQSQVRIPKSRGMISEAYYDFFIKQLYKDMSKKNIRKLKETAYYLEKDIRRLFPIKSRA
jgi:hypothetical protein